MIWGYGMSNSEIEKNTTRHLSTSNSSGTLLWCGTSIGANVSEAIGAISKPEFKAKMSIAYKECLETQYWLKLLKDTGYIKPESFKSIFADADELGKILFSTVRSCSQ